MAVRSNIEANRKHERSEVLCLIEPLEKRVELQIFRTLSNWTNPDDDAIQPDALQLEAMQSNRVQIKAISNCKDFQTGQLHCTAVSV